MGFSRPKYSMNIAASILLKEPRVTHELLKDNFTAHCGNALACIFIRLLHLNPTLEQLAALAPRMIFTTFAFAYSFDIANQTSSVEEDSINKPARPIPSGRISKQGANVRWLLSWSIFPTIIYTSTGPRASALLLSWEVWILLFYVWPKFDNCVARNLFTAVGAVIQLALLDAVLAHDIRSFTARGSLSWLLFFWLLMTIHVQEFHDMLGDRSIGRQTLPLLLGPRSRFWLRVMTAVVMAATTMVNIILARYTRKSPLIVYFLGFCHLLSMSVLASRLVVLRFKAADKITYKYYYVLATYVMLIFHANTENVLD